MKAVLSERGVSAHRGGEKAPEGESESIAVQLCFPLWLVALGQLALFLQASVFPYVKWGCCLAYLLHGALMRG